MQDFENSLKENYPDSFIPGLSQLQANMVTFRHEGTLAWKFYNSLLFQLGFLIGTFIFILLILLNWALIYTEKKRNRQSKRRTSNTGKENYQRISNSSSCESIFKKVWWLECTWHQLNSEWLLEQYQSVISSQGTKRTGSVRRFAHC